MSPFVHDSKLFLAGGLINDGQTDRALSSKIYELFFDKVGDDNGKKKSFLRISEAAPDSIPPPPTALLFSYIVNVGGKVYLLVYDGCSKFRMMKREEGFWVLGSGGKEWQGLLGPPPMYLDGFGRTHEFFVLQDKLYLEAVNVREGDSYLYAFDTETNKWDQLDDNIRKSFAFLEDELEILFPSIMVASLTLPDNNRNRNCRVTLSSTGERLPYSQVRVKIYAMLLNNQDNSVFCYQSLDEVSEAIQPTSFTGYTTRLNFVELGNGLVCALVNGFPPEHNYGTRPVLCVLVFALSFTLNQPADAFGFGGKEQRFLNVDVRVNRVFTLMNLPGYNFMEDLEHAFIFPSEEEEQHACSKGGNEAVDVVQGAPMIDPDDNTCSISGYNRHSVLRSRQGRSIDREAVVARDRAKDVINLLFIS